VKKTFSAIIILIIFSLLLWEGWADGQTDIGCGRYDWVKEKQAYTRANRKRLTGMEKTMLANRFQSASISTNCTQAPRAKGDAA